MKAAHGLVALLLGAAGAVARYFHEIMTTNTEFRWVRFPMVVFIGGFMGFMGSELALANGLTEQWAGIAAGALGASGAYGFELIVSLTNRLKGHDGKGDAQ